MGDAECTGRRGLLAVDHLVVRDRHDADSCRYCKRSHRKHDGVGYSRGTRRPRRLADSVAITGEASIHASNDSDLAIMPNGTVKGWGTTEVAKASMTPVSIPKLNHVVQVSGGDHSFVAIEAPNGIQPGSCPSDTTVWTWGFNIYSDLGVDSTARVVAVPVHVTALDGLGVVQVVAASWHMFALTCTGQVYVWGSNVSEDLGTGAVANQPVPVKNPYLTSLTGGTSSGVTLTTGSFAADILVNGSAYGWGNNRLQCGCGSTAQSVGYPTRVQQSVPFTSISAGGDFDFNGHTVALDSSGRVWCWGNDTAGQCGLGTTSDVSIPTVVPGLPTIVQAAAGGASTLYLDHLGDVWISGTDRVIKGVADPPIKVHPVKVLSGMTLISAGAEHSLAAGP